MHSRVTCVTLFVSTLQRLRCMGVPRAHDWSAVKKKKGQQGSLPAGPSASSAARWQVSYPTRSCRWWASVSPQQVGAFGCDHRAPVVYCSQGWRVAGGGSLLSRPCPRLGAHVIQCADVGALLNRFTDGDAVQVLELAHPLGHLVDAVLEEGDAREVSDPA